MEVDGGLGGCWVMGCHINTAQGVCTAGWGHKMDPLPLSVQPMEFHLVPSLSSETLNGFFSPLLNSLLYCGLFVSL